MPKHVPRLAGIGPIVTTAPDGRRVTLPISEIVEANGLVFIAGQSGHDDDFSLPAGGVAIETRIALEKIGERLHAAGLDFQDVVHATVMLADWEDFETARMEMSAEYARFFPTDAPVRLTFGVAHLPLGGHVEIQLIAAR